MGREECPLSSDGLVIVLIITEPQLQFQVFGKSPAQCSINGILLGTRSEWQPGHGVVLIIIGQIVEITEVQVCLIIQHESGRKVQGQVIVLRVEDRLRVV